MKLRSDVFITMKRNIWYAVNFIWNRIPNAFSGLDLSLFQEPIFGDFNPLEIRLIRILIHVIFGHLGKHFFLLELNAKQ